jgi:fructosamine-3-kinase
MLLLRAYSLFFLFVTFFSRVCAFTNLSFAAAKNTCHSSLAMTPTTPETFLDAMSQAASEALGRKVELVATSGGGATGGGGASTSAVLDKMTNTKYFVKSARGELKMLRAEYEGVKAMAVTNTIQVPTPIAYGEYAPTNQAFVLFEYLKFCGGGSQYDLGVMLAKVGS